MEELFEVLSWRQLGIHNKPCGLLNATNYYDYLVRFLDHAVDQGFLKAQDRSLLLVEQTPEALLDRFEKITAVGTDRFQRNVT